MQTLHDDTELTPTQVAEMLHVNVPYATLLMKKGFIDSHQIGTDWRANARNVTAYMEEREQLNKLQVEARYSRDHDLQQNLEQASLRGRQRYLEMVAKLQGGRPALGDRL